MAGERKGVNRERYEIAKDLACAFQNLTVDYNGTKLIHNVTGYIRRRGITAVLGSSASGKSVLLQTLSGQIQDLNITGSVFMSARKIDPKLRSNSVAYVPQEDVLIGELTVREMVTISTTMKRVENMRTINNDVSELLDKLGLGDVADKIIGNLIFSGLSAGQKKRTQMAAELIDSPSILMLDEPTSGLDASAAYEAISYIRDLVKHGVHGLSVMLTIHQPNSQLLSLFDDIVLLDGGEVIFFGTVPKAERHFSRCGFACPQNVTSTDFFLVISSADFSHFGYSKNQFDFKEEYRQSADGRHAKEILKYHQHYAKSFPGFTSRMETAFLVKRVPLWNQVYILLYREYLVALRDPMLYYFQFVMLMIFSVLIGAVFWELPDTISDNFNVFPSALLWLVLINGWIHALKVYHLCMSNRRSTLDISNEKCSSMAIFLAELISTSTLVVVFIPVSMLAYYMMGFPSRSLPFVLFVLWISSLATEAMIAVLSKLTKDATTAMVLSMVLLITLEVFAGGVFIAWRDTPDYWLWLQEMAIFTQSTRAINVQVLRDMHFKCVLTNGVCIEPGSGITYDCAEVSADGNTCLISGHEVLFVAQGIGTDTNPWDSVGYLLLIYFCLKLLVLFFTIYPADRVKFQLDGMLQRAYVRWCTADAAVENDSSSDSDFCPSEYNSVYSAADDHSINSSTPPHDGGGDAVLFKHLSVNSDFGKSYAALNNDADANANFSFDSGHAPLNRVLSANYSFNSTHAPLNRISSENSSSGSSFSSLSRGASSASLGKRQIHTPERTSDAQIGSPLPVKKKQQHGTALTWTDFSVTHRKTGVKIINNVSGYLRSGSVLALMGPSGAGKTTLLNGLARQSGSNTRLTGNVMFANRPLTLQDLTYVPQIDDLNRAMTVYEHIELVGRLASVYSERMMDHLDEILDVLGLTKRHDVPVGLLSGGEKKRLGIGIGLISNPKVLFLVEPTTGLDAAAAYSIVRYLVKLARKRNIAVILSIQQPCTLTFECFDKLCLLEKGQLAFFGSRSVAAKYFGRLGYENPQNISPADYYVDILQQQHSPLAIAAAAVNRQEHEQEPKPKQEQQTGPSSGEIITISGVDGNAPTTTSVTPATAATSTTRTWSQQFLSSPEGNHLYHDIADILVSQQQYQEKSPSNTTASSSVAAVVKSDARRPNVLFRLVIMIMHFFKCFVMEPGYYIYRLSVLLVIAFLLGTLFFDLQPVTSQLQEYVGSVFFASMVVMLSAIMSTALYVRDSHEAVTRIQYGFYQPGVFVIAQFAVSSVYNIIAVSLYMALFYWLSDISSSLDVLLYCILISWGHVSVMESVLMVLIECLKDEFLCTSAGIVFLGGNMLFAGFFRHAADMPAVVSWLCYAFPLHWSFSGFAWKILENLDFTAANVQSHTTIPGNMILHNVFHLEHIDPWKMFYILMAYVVGFRLVQYLLLAWQTDTLPWMLALVWCKRKHTDNLSVSISATEFTTPTGNDNSKTFCQFRLWPIHSSAVYPLRNDHNSNNNNGQLSSSSTVVMESIGSASSRRTGSGHIVSLPNDTEGHITAGMMTQQEQHDAPMPHNVTLGNNAEATMVVASSTPVEVPNNDNSSSNGNDAVGTAVSNNILVVDTADSVESFKKLPEEEEESRGVQ